LHFKSDPAFVEASPFAEAIRHERELGRVSDDADETNDAESGTDV